jgi:hypothetical protein
VTKRSANTDTNPPGSPSGGPGAARRWGLLLVWIVGIWAFVYLLAPQAYRIESVRIITDYIRANDIDATAYFYTEIEESGMAEQGLRNALTYSSSEDVP